MRKSETGLRRREGGRKVRDRLVRVKGRKKGRRMQEGEQNREGDRER